MSFVTTDDGTTLWWEAVGRGEPLLLIQGLGYPSDMWYRVIGPLSNLPEFQRAFSCKQGDAMVRAERCEVW